MVSVPLIYIVDLHIHKGFRYLTLIYVSLALNPFVLLIV